MEAYTYAKNELHVCITSDLAFIHQVLSLSLPPCSGSEDMKRKANHIKLRGGEREA